MKVLFVNSAEPACGVHQFGMNLFNVLKKSADPMYAYVEPRSEDEFVGMVDQGADFVLVNFYPAIFPWFTLDTLNEIRNRNLKVATIFHEVPVTGFDGLLYPDPTFKGYSRLLNDWFSIGRPIPKIMPPADDTVDLSHPIIGTSGFGFNNKGYVRLVEKVMEEFDHAIIRMHLPFARYGDITGARAREVAKECRALLHRKPGVTLEIDHRWLSQDEYIGWLAANDINCYLYDEMPGRGIASTIDFALMANRPIAVSKTTMFRHMAVCEPSVYVEDSSIAEILARGMAPLIPLYTEFAPERLGQSVGIAIASITSGERINRLLRNSDRDFLGWLGVKMRHELPDMMSRKIPEANVQQEWMVAQVRLAKPMKTLCVGCYEDTAFELLKKERHVVGIDPLVNGKTLRQFVLLDGGEFECVFATSVIEHVDDDEQFIADMCSLLAHDGVGLLTCDFKEGWKKGDPLPATDERLYTSADIDRLGRVLRKCGCYWIDKPDTKGAPDFHYQGHDYSFMALCFKKL